MDAPPPGAMACRHAARRLEKGANLRVIGRASGWITVDVAMWWTAGLSPIRPPISLAADAVCAEAERADRAAGAAVLAVNRQVAAIRGIGRSTVGLARTAGPGIEAGAGGRIELLIVVTGHPVAAGLVREVAHLATEGVRPVVAADGERVAGTAVRAAG